MNIDRDELDSLVALFDDDDTVVTECVDRRLTQLGPEVVRSLIYCSASERDSATREAILAKAESLNYSFKLEALRDFASRRSGPLSLFEGAYIICSMLDCRLRRDTMEDLFFNCSSEYLAEASDQRTGVENVRIFNYLFFNKLGFTLRDVELLDPSFSMVSDTLRTKQGNPFVTAYIYLMIAQVVGLPLQPLCFPGGFVPAYVENGKELFYVNVFQGGAIFLKNRLRDMIKVTGLNLSDENFRLRGDSAVMTIYLESLLHIHSNQRKGDKKKCPAIERALDCFGPERFLTMDDPDDE